MVRGLRVKALRAGFAETIFGEFIQKRSRNLVGLYRVFRRGNYRIVRKIRIPYRFTAKLSGTFTHILAAKQRFKKREKVYETVRFASFVRVKVFN